MVFLAGQTGVDRDGNVADGGVVPQFERAMTNLLTALGAAGGLPSDLVSLTIYLTDVPDYQAHARKSARSGVAGRNGVPGHGGGGRDPAVAARAAGRDQGIAVVSG
jgi:enamine deaminase RidA (YjgF/YER057c/UK114 family)